MPETSITIAAPGSEPVTTAEAKEHLFIASGVTAHDTKLTALIEAGRQQWEHDSQRLSVARAVTEKLDSWPDDCFRLTYKPNSITSVNYYDTSNADTLLASSVYSLDAPNRQLNLAVDQDWPTVEDRWDAITIVYDAGETREIDKQAILLQIDIMFEERGASHTDKDACRRAYDRLVEKYGRASYP